MQLTERNPVFLGIIATALIVLFTFVALSVQRSDIVAGYEITAEFSDANGLRVGDQVMVAGVRAGRVLGLEIVEDRVEARLQVTEVDLPADTTARVVLRTLVGTRAVALDAGSDYDDLLGEDDRIPLERTSVTIDVPEFGEASDELLSEIDSEGFNLFLRSLTDLTEGQREEVAELIDGGTRLSRVVNEQETQIRELLRQLRGVGETLNSRDAELVAIIDDFDVVLGQLGDRRADLQRLFRETNRTSADVADLIVDTRTELDSILDEVHRITAVLNDNQMNISEGLAYVGDAITGFASIAYAGPVEVPWGDVFVTSLGPVGVDVLLGCGSLLDQQLDTVLGPDPRSCEEQEHDTFPDDVRGPAPGQGPQPPIPELPLSQSSERRSPVDAVARRLLLPAELGAEEVTRR
jgi:phospholipid/cholesterol/gamma-HCH transport system substrate-binding protein